MNSGMGLGIPDFGSLERNQFMANLVRGVEDWLRLSYSDTDGRVLTYDSSKAFRLKWETPSGGGGGGGATYARLSRVTSAQTGISGSWAQDYLQYNEITTDPSGMIASISGDDITLSEAGLYLILQTLYSNNNLSGYINVSVNGSGTSSSDPVILASTTALAYFRYNWVIQTTAANQVLKMGFISSATSQMEYTDGYRPGNVNFLEILKLA